MHPPSIELGRESGNAHIAGRETMATYILLLSFTDQGIRNVKDTSKRADTFKDMAKKCGATVKDLFWTLGEYDAVAVVETPDDTSMTALGFSTGALGNVRSRANDRRPHALPPARREWRSDGRADSAG